MSIKVKRGLGLLVVALLAFLVFSVSQGQGGLGFQLVTVVTGLVLVIAGLSGLVLLAWGLLGD